MKYNRIFYRVSFLVQTLSYSSYSLAKGLKQISLCRRDCVCWTSVWGIATCMSKKRQFWTVLMYGSFIGCGDVLTHCDTHHFHRENKWYWVAQLGDVGTEVFITLLLMYQSFVPLQEKSFFSWKTNFDIVLSEYSEWFRNNEIKELTIESIIRCNLTHQLWRISFFFQKRAPLL